jgi:hypothetical protein
MLYAQTSHPPIHVVLASVTVAVTVTVTVTVAIVWLVS